MNAIQKCKVIKAWYQELLNKNVASGHEVFVLTDGIDCLIVPDKYDPKDDDLSVFCIRMLGGEISCILMK